MSLPQEDKNTNICTQGKSRKKILVPTRVCVGGAIERYWSLCRRTVGETQPRARKPHQRMHKNISTPTRTGVQITQNLFPCLQELALAARMNVIAVFADALNPVGPSTNARTYAYAREYKHSNARTRVQIAQNFIRCLQEFALAARVNVVNKVYGCIVHAKHTQHACHLRCALHIQEHKRSKSTRASYFAPWRRARHSDARTHSSHTLRIYDLLAG